MTSHTELLRMQCRHTETALTDAQIDEYLAVLPDWALLDGKLTRTFAFKDYYQTLAFVNALAWVVHAEDHHPELLVSYNRCQVRFDTHSVNHGAGGISQNDFICAAKADAVAGHGLA